MIHLSRVAVPMVWNFALVALAGAQVPVDSATPMTIKVVVTEQGTAETPVAAQPRTVSVTTDANGKFSVDVKTSEARLPAECPSLVTGQRVGTRVEGTVRPAADGRFQVNLNVTDRAIAGCRVVGGLNIPVFSNRIVSNAELVAIGDVIPFTIDNASGETLKVELSLAAGK